MQLSRQFPHTVHMYANAGPLAPIGWGQPGNDMAAAFARGGHVSLANSSVHTPARILQGSGQQQQQQHQQHSRLQQSEEALSRAEDLIQKGRCQEAVAIIRGQVRVW
jgi:hypothetical protein